METFQRFIVSKERLGCCETEQKLKSEGAKKRKMLQFQEGWVEAKAACRLSFEIAALVVPVDSPSPRGHFAADALFYVRP